MNLFKFLYRRPVLSLIVGTYGYTKLFSTRTIESSKLLARVSVQTTLFDFVYHTPVRLI